MDNTIILILLSGILALSFAYFQARWVSKQNPGEQKLIEIGDAIREGAMAFIKAEYSVLSVFVIAVAVLLYLWQLASFDTYNFGRDGSHW